MSTNTIQKSPVQSLIGSGFGNWLRARFSGNNSLVLMTAGLFAVMYIIGSIIYSQQNFGSLNSFFSMLNSNPHLIVIAAGTTMVIVAGAIDISVGGQLAMYCMMLAYFIQNKGANPYVMVGVVLVTGIVFGFVQGLLVAYLRLQPFIVTLGGMFFARGMTAIISPQTITITNPQFMNMVNFKIKWPWGGYLNRAGVFQQPFIYISVVIAVVVVAIMFLMMTQSRFGRHIYAVGGNEQSAMLMGLNTQRTKLAVFTLNGFLTAIGGFLFTLMSPGGAVEKAQGYEIKAIAAAVIGGALLTGGVGSIVGSFIGLLVQTTITKLINSNGTLANGWDEIVLGVILSLFIVLQAIVALVRRRRE